MRKFIIEEFQKSLHTGFIDKDSNSEILYQPELLVNQKNPKKKVLTTIIQEMNNCETFYFSVAFVTTSGIAALIETFKSLEKKNIKGKLLVSQYLNFTQPEALKRLSKFKNIELKIATNDNVHSKGYLFKSADHFNLIIGSSNMTATALTTNKEWNLKVSALRKSSIADKVLSEFEYDFKNATVVTNEFISSYEIIYHNQRLQNERLIIKKIFESKEVQPNSMQLEALKNLKHLRSQNKKKALLISATGTGKTYLSAFDTRACKAKKLLFVVHRLNIAEKAMETFQTVFGDTRTMGIYSGKKLETKNDFLFATVQTISKQHHLDQFDSDQFDYIVIDESHRSGAESYKRLVEYFSPQFLLGMTATPERTDGNDIFKIFDHNIAYEIRLNRAMEEDMLSQFHYYGVADITVDNEVLENNSDFKYLVADERVEKIISNAEFYGCDNGLIRGLVFCSRNEEAKELSDKFNMLGYKTVALSGNNSEADRNEAITRLESDNTSNKLDYIFTVDIFNEGIDIPSVNQIIMLRPTNSSIIFIQQLGRGLRKTKGKEYLTIIDFIGNYQNNYLIPIALYGDNSYNKDTLRKLMSEGSRMIPGASTINFDEITKERIFKSIDVANLKRIADLKNAYLLLKYRLGRIPMMMDFIENEERDPYVFIEYSKSYFNFLCNIEEEFESEINNDSKKLLELFSSEINNSKRIEESIILLVLIKNDTSNIEELRKYIIDNYGFIVSESTFLSCINNLNFKFIREKKDGSLIPVGEIYNLNIIAFEDKLLKLHDEFKAQINQNQFKTFLLDSINYSLFNFTKTFDLKNWVDGFMLYQKYSRKDVFRIINFPENPVAQNVGGYMVSPDKSICPIFVNYHKEEHISDTTKYEDKFLNNKEFEWMSKSNRKLSSEDVRAILGEFGEIRLPLFIKKNNDEGMEFYYLGDITPVLDKNKETYLVNDTGKKVSVVKILFHLKTPVEESIYNYLTQTMNFESEVVSDIVPTLPTISAPTAENYSDLKSTKNLIPFYNLYAAATSFTEMQYNEEYELIEAPLKYKPAENYFACKVIGESMNKAIPNGSICLFKKYSAGSRNGTIVLVENIDRQDPDMLTTLTVKTYLSEKLFDVDTWGHKSIILRPKSYDKSYKDIIVDENNNSGMKVVGEFVTIL